MTLLHPHLVARVIAFYATHGSRCKVGHHPTPIELYCQLTQQATTEFIRRQQHLVAAEVRRDCVLSVIHLVPASAMNVIRLNYFWLIMNYCTTSEQQQVVSALKEHYALGYE